MSLEALRQAWRARLGEEPPKHRVRELLALGLAYRLQARVHGDLPGPLKRRAAELGRRFSEDRNYTPTPGPVLKPGSSLIKEWRGVRHEVRVLEEGFSYLGERMGSLSEAAERITGTKWNSHVFFGLKARRR
jgi:hypothetical protein